MSEEVTLSEPMDELAALNQPAAEREARGEQVKQEAVQSDEERFKTLFEFAPEALYLHDLEGRFIDGNRAAEQIIGYKRDELIGHNLLDLDLLLPQERPKAVAGLTRGRRGEPTGPDEFILNRKDGSQVTVEVRTIPIKIKGQSVILGLARDLADYNAPEKTQEQDLPQVLAALRKSEATQQAILEAIPDLMFRLSRDGVFLDFHAPQSNDLLTPPDEFLGKKVSQVLPPELAQQIIGAIERVYQTNETQTIEYQLLIQGEIKYFEARLALSSSNEILTIARNITDRKQTEEALRQSEATQRALLDAIPDFLFRINRDGEYIPLHTPHSKELQGTGQVIARRKIGEALPPDLAQRIGPLLERVFQTGETQIFEYSLPFPGEIRHYEARLVISGDEILCILRDITERKQAEETLRLQNEQLQARNQELDAYARTVAHDLRNPLATLTTMAEFLAEDHTRLLVEQLEEYLCGIARSGRKASGIIDGLLLLAGVRQQTITPQPLDMASLVAEAQERLAEMIKEYQAEIVIPSNWPTVWGYAPWVEEVWVNYLSNGLKYGGVPPRLELGVQVQADGTARFWVKDSGPGLTPEAQSRLFTEFTQLDPDRADGYGLGLSIVRRIIEKLGGQVGVESEGIPGRGSIFSFTLPLVKP